MSSAQRRAFAVVLNASRHHRKNRAQARTRARQPQAGAQRLAASPEKSLWRAKS